MAWRPAAVLAASMTGALVVLAAGSEDVCAGGAACAAGPSGEEDEAGLLQLGRTAAQDHVLGPALVSWPLASAVSRALAARRDNASAPSVEDIERSIRGHYALALGDVINSAIEDSALPDEAKELAMKELKDPSSGTTVALMGVVGKSDVAGAVRGALSDSDSPFDYITDKIKEMINSNTGGIMDKLKSAASGGAAKVIEDKFGIDICDLPFDLPIDIPGFSKSDMCSSSASSCSTDTGGTCSFGGCSASRNAVCSNGACVCSSGSCAQGGQCVSAPTPSPIPSGSSSCPSDTGGTCTFGGCSSSRNAVCSNGNCVCSAGTCAQGGQCVSSR